MSNSFKIGSPSPILPIKVGAVRALARVYKTTPAKIRQADGRLDLAKTAHLSYAGGKWWITDNNSGLDVREIITPLGGAKALRVRDGTTLDELLPLTGPEHTFIIGQTFVNSPLSKDLRHTRVGGVN